MEILERPKVSIVFNVSEKSDSDVRRRILGGAQNLFNRYGVRSVTMDDVARELSVSKKTLYQYCTNKDGLVSAVAHFHMEEEKEEYATIARTAKNSIDELHRIAQCMRKSFQGMNPSLLYDVQKFHQEAWSIYLKFKHDFLKGNIESNLKRGMAEGHYRPDINPEILAILRVEQVEMLFDQKVFPTDKYDFVEIQLTLFNHFVRGLLTEKGRKLYENYSKLNAKSSPE